MSNFDFLVPPFDRLRSTLVAAEEDEGARPTYSMTLGRIVLEETLGLVAGYPPDSGGNGRPSLSVLMASTVEAQRKPPPPLDARVVDAMEVVRGAGNDSVHRLPEVVERDARKSLSSLSVVMLWACQTFGKPPLETQHWFDNAEQDRIARKAESNPVVLRKQLDTARDKKKEAEREAAAWRKVSAAETKRAADLERQLAQMSAQQDELMEMLTAPPPPATEFASAGPHPWEQAGTRAWLINHLLASAGWEIGSRADDIDYLTEFFVADVDGVPVGLLETSHSLVSLADGLTLADLAADRVEAEFGHRPVVYASNGFKVERATPNAATTPVDRLDSPRELQELLNR